MPLGLAENIVNALAGFLKFLRLMRFPDVSLHHADRAHVLLHGSVQLVIFRKSLLEVFHGSSDDEKQYRS